MIGLLVGIGIGATARGRSPACCWEFSWAASWARLAGAVLAEPRNLLVAVIGSALLVLLGVVVRVFSSIRPHET